MQLRGQDMPRPLGQTLWDSFQATIGYVAHVWGGRLEFQEDTPHGVARNRSLSEAMGQLVAWARKHKKSHAVKDLVNKKGECLGRTWKPN